MPLDPIFDRVFRKLYGKPCWGVKQGVGSFLTFDFGKPYLTVIEPKKLDSKLSPKVRESAARRRIFVHGEWHLWIQSCSWTIFSKGKQLASSNSPDQTIQEAANILDGQKLVRFSLSARSERCTFEFDLGGLLVTSRPHPDDEHWQLFEPTGRVLTVRGRRKWSYKRSNEPWGAGPWRPVMVSEKQRS